ncbi:TfoX/Sxy family protein [Geothrix limicola]|uniref:TfoX/Sxy family protein n=1 Tax=Geothrix limicola TaxID=2927978 RepID=UPI003B75CE3A
MSPRCRRGRLASFVRPQSVQLPLRGLLLARTPPQPFRNLGPKSTNWMYEVGIHSMADLHALGAIEAYRRVKASRKGVTVVLLYALQGAILDCHWNDLPPGMKEILQSQAKDL